jgi:hypothetical protein
LRCQRARYERLAGARRPVEEHAARRLHAKLVKDLGVQQRQEDHLLER